MRLGVLDIGSNSAQLQIVDAVAGAPPLPLHAVKVPTRLGEDIARNGSISVAGTERAVSAVCTAVRAALEFEVDQLYPFVTSAIRDATNRDDVLDAVAAESGVRPQYLSGEQEAHLTYLAVRRWYGWQAGSILDLDIGGGSMEVAFGRSAAPEVAVSLPLGAGRMTRTFLTDDPPARSDLKRLRQFVRDQIGGVADRLRWEGAPRRVVATSKTFKQLARLAGAPRRSLGPFIERSLDAGELHIWVKRMARMPVTERAQLRGISPGRASQIVAGAVVAEEAMRGFEIQRVEVSPWALREGIVLRHLAALDDGLDQLALQTISPQTNRNSEVTRLSRAPRPEALT